MPDIAEPEIRQPALSMPAATMLRKRIAPLCHALRVVAPLYALSVIGQMLQLWIDPAHVQQTFRQYFGVTVVTIELWQRIAGFAVHFAIWLLIVGVCFSIWQLFGGFLRGRVFTAEAAAIMRRAAFLGLAATLADILSRPLLTALATLSNPPGERAIAINLSTQDLLNLMLIGAFLALAHVHKVATDIADENASFV